MAFAKKIVEQPCDYFCQVFLKEMISRDEMAQK